MGSAKRIEVRPIKARAARNLICALHYSAKAVNNSWLHLGVFIDGALLGAMQFGPPMDKRKMLGLVRGTAWDGMLELNRMAFSDELPRNSESRAIGVACRILRRTYPRVRWIVSFSDATQCGDGAIYRASGFLLTLIKPSLNLARLPDGRVIHKMSVATSKRPLPELGGRTFFEVTGGTYSFRAYVKAAGATIVPGFQLRYIKFIDPSARADLAVPVIPFSEIQRRGAAMYRGEKIEAREVGDG